jgi:coenzyme Q-binding protein COQ10
MKYPNFLRHFMEFRPISFSSGHLRGTDSMHASKTHVFEGANARELMPLFADVEAFPSFVPNYKSAVVVERVGNQYKTKSVMALQLGFFALEEELDSVTTLTFPSCIEAHSTGTKFIRSFSNVWRFRDVPGGCEVTFDMTLDIAAVPAVVQPIFADLVELQAERILQAFVARFGAQRQAA